MLTHSQYGTNWRALVVTLVTIAPLLPGIANTTNSVPITAGARNLYTFNRLYCFFVSSASYYLVGKLWPEKKTIIPEMVPIIIDVSVDSPAEKGGLESGLDGTKGKQGEGV